jgi:hypothetical protein
VKIFFKENFEYKTKILIKRVKVYYFEVLYHLSICLYPFLVISLLTFSLFFTLSFFKMSSFTLFFYFCIKQWSLLARPKRNKKWSLKLNNIIKHLNKMEKCNLGLVNLVQFDHFNQNNSFNHIKKIITFSGFQCSILRRSLFNQSFDNIISDHIKQMMTVTMIASK